MNLDDLRAAQVDERGTDSLQPLRPTFYADAADYLADLRARRDRLADRVDDPFDSAQVRQLTDELETAQEVVEAIYERRVGKLVKRASLAATGVPTDEDGLTDEEQALFADLVERLEAHRETVLDVLAAEGDPTPTGPADPTGTGDVDDTRGEAGDEASPDVVESGDAGASEPAEDPPAAAAQDEDPAPDGGTADEPPVTDDDADRVTVRITAEVGEIYGVDDRVYTLGDEDVVTLPSANARPLLERGAAQRVE